MECTIESAYYLCGKRWSVYGPNNELLCTNLKTEDEAKVIARTFERVYWSGFYKIPMNHLYWHEGVWHHDKQA